MAHTKAAGSAKRTVDVAGKRLGIKKFAGEYVRPGNIIVRQHGTAFHAGVGTMLGRDYTVFAVNEGFVSFRQMTGYKRNQKLVDVLPTRPGTDVKSTKVQPAKGEAAEVEVEAAPKAAKATKPATKKPAAKTTKKATAKK